MKVTEHIKKAKGKTLFSFEILPPKKGENVQGIFDAIDPLMEFNPPFIDVTYHREEYIYKQRENGLLEKVTTRKRPGTVGICSAIMNKYGIDAVPHIICGGFSREETENALIDLDFLGIDNVLVLRGDAIKSEGKFEPDPDGHAYASELMQQVIDLNRGKYLHEEVESGATNFSIGISAYPEKHFESPSLKSDMKYLKQKVDMGAEYVVTQMFFDNKKYFDFVDKCREMDINVPIIPGLKPITTLNHSTILPSIFHVDLPDDLVDALDDCKDNAAVRAVGIEWCIQQSKELMAANVPCLHYYTMSRSSVIKKIAAELF
ncbi:MAG: methylenetetrahydrofolate reductase (NADPH) [Roseivirga sp.]|jgi:methylenetetrahydrofolate reductase (NADPH)